LKKKERGPNNFLRLPKNNEEGKGGGKGGRVLEFFLGAIGKKHVPPPRMREDHRAGRGRSAWGKGKTPAHWRLCRGKTGHPAFRKTGEKKKRDCTVFVAEEKERPDSGKKEKVDLRQQAGSWKKEKDEDDLPFSFEEKKRGGFFL